MSNTLKIYCTNIGEYIPVEGGEDLAAILSRISSRIGFTPICARVNNKTEALHYQVYAPKQVEYLPVESPSGSRVYIRSLCMMLYRAVSACYPGARLNIVHSVSRGYYCRLTGDVTVSDSVVDTLKRYMQDLVRRDVAFERKERLTSDVIRIFERQGLNDKVRLLHSTHELYTVYYRLDGVCDSYYGCLAPSTGQLGVFDLIPYKSGMLLLGRDPDNPGMPPKPVEQEKMFRAFTEYTEFNHVVGVSNVGMSSTTRWHAASRPCSSTWPKPCTTKDRPHKRRHTPPI